KKARKAALTRPRIRLESPQRRTSVRKRRTSSRQIDFAKATGLRPRLQAARLHRIAHGNVAGSVSRHLEGHLLRREGDPQSFAENGEESELGGSGSRLRGAS